MCAFALEQDRSARSTNVADFATYEDYLDNQVNERDMYYLQVRVMETRRLTGYLTSTR